MARGELGGGARLRRGAAAGIQEAHGRKSSGHHLEPLHQRGNLPGAEAGAGGLRQQQHRHLARVCHSPTGYGLGQAYGTSAGTQDFDSVEHTDVAIIIGANPTDGHPVFASRLKKRLRQGAKLVIIDPRRIDMVRSPHVEAAHHLPLRPGTNVAVVTAMAHVIVTEGLYDADFIRERCDWDEFQDYAAFVAEPRHGPEATALLTGVDAGELRAAARLYATGGTGRSTTGSG